MQPIWTAVGVALGLLNGFAQGEDWYRWRGPRLDGVSGETDWKSDWSSGQPRLLWKAAVGTGFSSFSISDGRLFTMGNRDDQDILWCIDAESGRLIWKHAYDCPLDPNLFEGGPTATPAVDDDLVVTFSRVGDVHCLKTDSGDVVWKRQLNDEEGLPIPAWGFSGSPLVTNDMVLLNAGASGIALHRSSGKTAWISEPEESGYASPVLLTPGPDGSALFASGRAISAVRVGDGEQQWSHRWITRYGVNAADPIVNGTQVFVSSGYAKGSTLLEVKSGQPEALWRSRNLRNQMSPGVLIDNFVYAFDGDAGTKAALRCIDIRTGDAVWSQGDLGLGALTAAAGNLIVLSEAGDLLVAPATSTEFRPTGRTHVVDGKCWTCPVLSNGRIYCRNATGQVVCLDVRNKSASR